MTFYLTTWVSLKMAKRKAEEKLRVKSWLKTQIFDILARRVASRFYPRFTRPFFIKFKWTTKLACYLRG